MPRQTVRFGKAARTPSDRHKEQAPRKSAAFKVPMNKPKGESEISQYVNEARDVHDESMLGALRQYQGAECEHGAKRIVVAASPTKEILKCPDCGHVLVKEVKQR